MDQIIESLNSWINRLAENNRVRSILTLFIVAGLVLVVGAFFIPQDFQAIQVILASVAGGLWYVAFYMAWFKVISQDLRFKLNFRSRVSVIRRRQITLPLLLVWFIILFLVYRNFEFLSPIIGAVNVVVLLIVWRMVTMNPLERQASEMAFEEEQQREIWIKENTPVIPEVNVKPEKRGLVRRIFRRNS